MTSFLKQYFLLGSFAFLASSPLRAQPVFDQDAARDYADSLYSAMTDQERMGQLFMVAAYSNKGAAHEKYLQDLVEKERIGGLIFFQGGPARQARITNKLQSAAKVPLLIGMDAEWDLGMRLDSAFKFPWQMTMGAVADSLLIYRVGFKMGEHLKRLGVHVSFSPVVDLNTNPKNPIINARSFGEDPTRVSKQSKFLMMGLQSAGVMACAKHFPGHGDTDKDSHLTLPTVSQSLERLETVEWEPYRTLFKNGLASVMVAHLNVPALDTTGTPSSLSATVVKKYLRNDLGFEGLIFTDALNMRGVSEKNRPGEVDLKALLAGNDILLFAEDVKRATQLIAKALENGSLPREDFEAHVKRVLRAKYWAIGKKAKPISTKNIAADLNDVESEILRKKIFESAATVLINRDKTLPIREISDKKIAFISLGRDDAEPFFHHLKLYAPVKRLTFDPTAENTLLAQLSDFDLVIVGHHPLSDTPWRNYKLTVQEERFLKKLGFQNHFVYASFANPYSLLNADFLKEARALVLGYQNHPDAQSVVAQVIFGSYRASGSLPVSVSELFTAGYGLYTANIDRLRYGYPEEVGIQRKYLEAIDYYAKKAISDGATPGCQVLIAKKGTVIYHKAFGHHDENRHRKVGLFDLYDLASVTKITATLPMVMKMYEDRLLDLDMPLEKYLPEAKGTNKADLSLRDVLAHQAGLQPWIPFYLKTLKDYNPLDRYYRTERSIEFPHQVAQNLYMRRDYPDSIFAQVLKSPIGTHSYKYSDLGYYLMQRMVEGYYRKPLDVLIDEHFFSKLGAYTLGYLPLDRFPQHEIVPTEFDKLYRKQLIHGYVHDQGAAMMGGVAGHAGLFSNANDLAKMMQMFLNGGEYGGERFIDPTTISEFVRCQFCENENRRGAGFDKPQIKGEGPTCGCLSMLSFGHTGFTGTIAWVDPEEEVVYVFLSNRVHPNAENRKMITGGYRTKIQQVIYDAIESSKNDKKTFLSVH